MRTGPNDTVRAYTFGVSGARVCEGDDCRWIVGSHDIVAGTALDGKPGTGGEGGGGGGGGGRWGLDVKSSPYRATLKQFLLTIIPLPLNTSYKTYKRCWLPYIL